MSENFVVEIITPNKSILKSETTEVILPSYEGQMGILKDHIPLITFLRPGFINIKNDGEEKIFFAEEGTVEFSQNSLLILSSTARSLNDFDKSSVEKIINQSEEKLSNADTSDKEKYLLSHKIDALREINQ